MNGAGYSGHSFRSGTATTAIKCGMRDATSNVGPMEK